jgi:hypothetical protein
MLSAVPWLWQVDARLLPCKHRSDHRPVHMGFLVDKVALEHVFLRVCSSSVLILCCVIIFHSYSTDFNSLHTFPRVRSELIFKYKYSTDTQHFNS